MSRRLIFSALLVATGLRAQDDSSPRILVQGTVVDEDSGAPIANAKVTILGASLFDPRALSGGAAQIVTGPAGDFQARVQGSGTSVSASAQAKGYARGSASVPLRAQADGVSIEVRLEKLQSISGTIVDDETRRPIPGLQVQVMGNGARGLSASSGADGGFFFSDLPRGEYFLRISARPLPVIEEISAQDLAGEKREKALEPPPPATSYGSIVWPGHDADVPSITGIVVGNQPVDVGEIRLSKAKLRNLSGLIDQCDQGSSLQLRFSLLSDSQALVVNKDTVCGAGFRLLNLPDGTYKLTGTQGFPQRRFGSQTIDAREEGPIHLALQAFIKIRISVEVEDGGPDDLPDATEIDLLPLDASIRVDSPTRLQPGTLEATLYPGERYTVSARAGDQFYIKRIAYNGFTLPDTHEITTSTATLSQLSVLLSKHPGAVEVHVLRGGKPVVQEFSIALVREGMSIAEFRAQRILPLNATGVMTYGGLAPGTYRAVRSTPAAGLPVTEEEFRAMLADPARVSPPVTLEEGQSATIDWEVK